ncbi:MAG: PKD domain-containing protein [Saprospiraceae bacterium]|nr:PKD domain-containing protein [Saprospiraceae bacterium]
MGVEKTCANLASFNYNIFPIAVRFKPVADLSVNPSIACVGAPIDFNNNSCENSNNPSYLWTINGQTFTTENVPDYVFNTPGTYNVTLAVTNTCGTDVAAGTVLNTPPATAAATPSATQLCAPDTVTFTNQSTNAVGYNWMVMPSTGWTFTNGTSSNSPTPAILFTVAE